MTSRDLVIRRLLDRMMEIYVTGDLQDAQNMEAFVCCLEHMGDAEYDEFERAAEVAATGTIS